MVVNLPQQFFGIGKLGQTLGIGEIGHFQSSEPGQNQLLHDPQFGTGGNQTLFALEPFPNRGVTDGCLLWESQSFHVEPAPCRYDLSIAEWFSLCELVKF